MTDPCPRCGSATDAHLCLDCQAPVGPYAWRCDPCLAEHERPGAEQLAGLRAELEEEKLLAGSYLVRANDAERERDAANSEALHWSEKVATVEKERDQANAAIERYRASLCEARQEREQALGEADAERAEVARVTEQYKEDVVRHAGELKAAYEMEKEAWAQNAVLKTAALERTPDGTQLCYLCDGVLVLLGDPDPEEDPEAPGAHNCDALGCGTMSHVKERRGLTAEQLERLGRGERVGLTDDGGSKDF